MEENVKVERMTFGKCKNCFIEEAVYSRGICQTCHDNKQRVMNELLKRGIETGTEEFIKELQLNGVYY